MKRERIEEARRVWWGEQRRRGLVAVDFDSIPPPPLGDSLRAIPWFFDVVAVCAYWAACDPFLTLRERARLLSRFVAVAGMLRDAAIESDRLSRIRDGCSPPPWGKLPRLDSERQPGRRDAQRLGQGFYGINAGLAAILDGR